ncbi:toxin-antitoxin system HicB family antitoxin [Clostridiaceae bacterium]|nr:toxin-antitoxin system HicB family antitoxin [Clostridium sp.]NBI73603.1 toxin-antitoxin system HicB family antitoxin [Clostridiaceae bacterium]
MNKWEYYMNLPYNKIIQEIHDESGHYFYGRILELDGCQSTGDTLEEFNANLIEAMGGHIEVMLENEMEIHIAAYKHTKFSNIPLEIPHI